MRSATSPSAARRRTASASNAAGHSGSYGTISSFGRRIAILRPRLQAQRLFNDRNEVVNGDTADATVRSGISRRRDKCLLPDADRAIEINRGVRLLDLLQENQRGPCRADEVMAIRQHLDGSHVTDMNRERLFRLQPHRSQSVATRPGQHHRSRTPPEPSLLYNHVPIALPRSVFSVAVGSCRTGSSRLTAKAREQPTG